MTKPKFLFGFAFLTILLVGFAQSNNADVVYLPMPKSNEREFRIVETSRPSLIVREGDSVSLNCRTNRPWQLCGWKQPTDIWCDRLMKASKFTTACHENPRIKYDRPKVSRLGDHEDVQSDCGITIVDVSTVDDGTWTCHAKEDVRQEQSAESSIKLSVASPYKVSLVSPANPSDLVLTLKNRTDEVEFICAANGSGTVKPKLVWSINGVNADPSVVKSWTETHSSGYDLIYLAIIINADLLDQFELLNSTEGSYHNLGLRCFSKQLFPNGTVIFQTSLSTQLAVLVREDSREAIEFKQDMNVAGITIVILISLAVTIAIILICWSKKYKKWCYANEDYKVRAVTRSNQGSQIEIGEEQIGFMSSQQIPYPPEETRRTVVSNGARPQNSSSNRPQATIEQESLQTSSSNDQRAVESHSSPTVDEESIQNERRIFTFELPPAGSLPPPPLPPLQICNDKHQNQAAVATPEVEDIESANLRKSQSDEKTADSADDSDIESPPRLSTQGGSNNTSRISDLRALFFQQDVLQSGVDINGNSANIDIPAIDEPQPDDLAEQSVSRRSEEDDEHGLQSNDSSTNESSIAPEHSPTAPPLETTVPLCRSPLDELPSLPITPVTSVSRGAPQPPVDEPPPLPPADTLPPPPLPPVRRPAASSPITFQAEVEIEPTYSRPVDARRTSSNPPPQQGRMDPNRLLELISAPPASLEIHDRDVSGSSSALPPYGSAPTTRGGLSDALTTPRKRNTRRQNEYVTIGKLPRATSLGSATTSTPSNPSASRSPTLSTPQVEMRNSAGDVIERRPVSETAL